MICSRYDNGKCASAWCYYKSAGDTCLNPRLRRNHTNADRIRGMSDGELAGWLVDATVCERVCGEDEYCHGNECVKRVTDWLQQPAKEDRE